MECNEELLGKSLELLDIIFTSPVDFVAKSSKQFILRIEMNKIPKLRYRKKKKRGCKIPFCLQTT